MPPHKHSNATVALLVVLVIILSVYILWNKNHEIRMAAQPMSAQQQTPGTTAAPETSATAAVSAPTDDGYLYVPELHIRFKKVQGLTMRYTIDKDSIFFSSDEIVNAAKTDSGISHCATDSFSGMMVTTIPKSQTDFQGYGQAALADGRYINVYAQQAMCYDPDRASAADVRLVENQQSLSVPFLKSVESY